MTTVQVDIGGIEFNTDGYADGVRWSLDITAGWDAAELRQDLFDQLVDGWALGAHGHRGRTIVCSGVVEAQSDAAHWAAYNRLAALTSPSVTVPFTVHEPDQAKRVQVLAGQGSPRIRTHNGRVFEFQLTLTALDPRKYGLTVHEYAIPAHDGVVVTVGGTSPTPLRVETTGAGMFNVQHSTSLAQMLGGPFPVGTVLDSSTRTVRGPDGTSQFGLLHPSFDWIFLTPTGSQVVNNWGDAPVTIFYRDAWI